MTDFVQGERVRMAVELQGRAKAFALRVVKVFRMLPRGDDAARILGRQLLRSATSVAANYRAACRARSRREFVAKIGVVVEEADETSFWLEFVGDAGIMPAKRLSLLIDEAKELVAIFSAKASNR